jgi:predicted transcriptional regulator
MAESDVCIDLVKRSPVLAALQDGPLDQRTLERRVASSQSTSYRVSGWLTELGVIEKPRWKFMLTPAGEEVTETVVTFKTNVRRILRCDTGDSDLLSTLIRCSPVLEVVREEPLDRREIEVQLGISNSTSHRHTRSLGELGLIEKSTGRFKLTEPGTAVADVVATFERDVAATLRLAPLLEAACDTIPSCPIAAFADATVTTAERGDSYSHVKQFITLVTETNTLCGLDIDCIAPFYIDELTQRVLDGMEIEAIDFPDVLEDTMDNYPYVCAKVCVNGDFTPWLHDDLPFGLAIFDDRVGIGVRDPSGRRLQMFVDTDSPAVREWANAVYDSYKDEAIRLERFTKKGLREAMATV